jgi:hypothetical protein
MKKAVVVVAFVLDLLSSRAAFATTIVLDANGQQDINNLQELALALHNYADTFGTFPGEFSGTNSAPLLSWRVAILPFIGESALYSQFDLTKPWNDPANLPLLNQMPAVFRDPLAPAGSTTTNYVGGSQSPGTNPATLFQDTDKFHYSSIIDGTSVTIQLGETISSAIPWTAPEDIPIGSCPTLGGTGFSSDIAGAVPFAFADGSVHLLLNTIDCTTLEDLFLINDRNAVTIPPIDVVSGVPEPATLFLLGSGIAAGAYQRFGRCRAR